MNGSDEVGGADDIKFESTIVDPIGPNDASPETTDTRIRAARFIGD